MTLKLRTAFSCLALLAIYAASLSAAESPSSAPAPPRTLTIADSAPTIDIEHWLSAAHAERGEVHEFERGKVYVVEFWATWCLPCIGSMPHLAELQTKYADQGVQIISVSQEPLEAVTKFLDRQALGSAEGKTYRQLTAAYNLTTDPDSSVFTSYMTASGRKVIPTAFLIGKSGKIEWIGHPKDLERPLESVLAGTWDVERFRQQWEQEQKEAAFASHVKELVGDGELDQALQLVDKEYADQGSVRHDLRESLKQLNLTRIARSGDKEATIAIVDDLLTQYQDDPQQLVQLSNQLRGIQRSIPLPQPVLDRTIRMLKSQIERESGDEKKSAVVSLVLLYAALGDKEKATEALGWMPAEEESPDDSK